MLQQKRVDAVAQDILFVIGERLLQTQAGIALLLQLGDHRFAGAVQISARDDVAVHFGDDFFDHAYIGGHGHTKRSQENGDELHILHCKTHCKLPAIAVNPRPTVVRPWLR